MKPLLNRKQLLISVIVNTYNSSSTIEKCLRSLLTQKIKPHEIIIVDGGSTDSTVKIIDDFMKNYSSITMILIKDPSSTPASNRNKGIYASSGNIIAFLDSDCEAPPEWIEIIYNFFSKNDNNRVVGVCGPYAPPYDSDNFTLFSYHSIGIILGKISSQFMRQEDKEKFVSSMPAGNSAYLKNVLVSVGGFNPKLRWCEDTDLGIRLRSKGYLLQFIPKMFVFHRWKGWRTIKSLCKSGFQYGFGRIISSRINIMLFSPFPFVFSILLAFLFLVAVNLPLILIIIALFYLIFILAISVKYRIITIKGMLSFPFFILSYVIGSWTGLFKVIFDSLKNKS